MNKALYTRIPKIIVTVLFFFITQFSNSQTVTVTTTGAGTFVVPCGVTSITVRAWGAGGAGGGSRNAGASGDGGGAGGYSMGTFTVTAGQNINYFVGNGGAGSTNDGANGGNTTIAGFGLAANGGTGGNRNGGTISGLGGTASGGTVNTSGANGAIGGSNTGGNGGAAPNGGTGGIGVANGNGGNGVAPGGGGGGGERGNTGGNRSGGDGGNGRIEITYTSTFQSYCLPSFNNGVEPITNVTFAGINNNSTNALGGPSLESFCITGSVVQGSVSNVISVKGNTDGNFTEFIKVYIDWDQNGVFGNTTNEIYDLGTITNSTGVDSKFATVNISVPVTAILGNTKMRVMKTYTVANSNNPCFSGNDWGQAEDYLIRVMAPPTITSFSPTSVCQGATFTIIGTNFTTTTNVAVNNIAVSSFIINSGTSITATVALSGTSGLVSVTNVYGSATSTGTLTVNALPTAPLPGSATQPTCSVATGSVTLNSLPSTGTWTLTRSGTSSATTTGTGSSTTISGLAPGTYTFTVSNGTCVSLASDNVVINPVVTNTWNGTAWSTGLVPTSTQKIVFAGNFNQDVDLVGCSCKVTGSATVTIKSNRTLAITNEVEVVGGGTLTFENKASLVQINDAAVNAGNIIYKRLTNTGVRNTDYTYWSSPVSPLNLGGTGGISYNPSSLVGSIFYSYEVTAGSEDWKSESATSPMIVGKGYSIRGPGPISVSPLTLLEVTFAGKPNNGRYPITGIYPFKSYLIGNPYPSALDADKFLTDNAGVIDGTLYFWTHSTKIGIGVVNPGTGVYAYSGDDYASYNLTGGVGTVADSDPDKTLSNPNKPTGKIGAGQGFFATSNTTILGTNEIVFNNSMRVGVGGITGNNSQIFKTNSTKSKTTSAIEKNRVWLNLTNTEGAFKQLLVGYITGATNDYDNGYDGETFDGNEFIDFYSVNQNKKFVIQGRALPFDENDEVSLGYRSVAIGNFSIGIDEVDGMMQSQKVYIEDKLLNVVHDLKASSYDFTTQAGTFNDRFVLRYIDKTLGAGDFEAADDKVVISVKNKQIKIDSSDETIDKVLIFDLIGKQLYKKINVGNNEHVIPNLSSSEQVLIVKIVLQNGQTVSKKVIF
ncbi:MAG: T9SS sorting signal type C domain-containing protein [Flavobacterium sp.]|uniref:T9SS sorting signal type C domain-containing protein n=1 Tax=Flavobacterium sp. TaxID=239 RepID=UPI00273775BC|nr:T9SS sorting signal type C domain-containing protein [Flavobacterium sp.]MDP3681848.1 T9SS sorting signal type C domain-containing protein [Flavobacterium sp.]MDZ4331064.1 T9SS sorting signal type C domain-containing protein [Flavobacterium sp.]